MTFAPLVGGLAAEVDWRLAFVGVAVVAALLAVAGLPRPPARPRRPAPPARRLAPVGAAARPRRRAGVGRAGRAVVPRRPARRGRLRPRRRAPGALLTAFGVAGLLTARLVGAGVDRLGPRVVVRLGALAAARARRRDRAAALGDRGGRGLGARRGRRPAGARRCQRPRPARGHRRRGVGGAGPALPRRRRRARACSSRRTTSPPLAGLRPRRASCSPEPRRWCRGADPSRRLGRATASRARPTSARRFDFRGVVCSTGTFGSRSGPSTMRNVPLVDVQRAVCAATASRVGPRGRRSSTARGAGRGVPRPRAAALAGSGTANTRPPGSTSTAAGGVGGRARRDGTT